jgi:hypothetical protein
VRALSISPCLMVLVCIRCRNDQVLHAHLLKNGHESPITYCDSTCGARADSLGFCVHLTHGRSLDPTIIRFASRSRLT